MWKVLSLLSCFAYVVHVSLAYNNVLMTQALYTAIFILLVSFGFVKTRVVRRANVVAALPILWLISVSRERLSVTVEPRYVNCWTAPSSYSSMVMSGGVSVSCPKTFVFLRLMVSQKVLAVLRKAVH